MALANITGEFGEPGILSSSLVRGICRADKLVELPSTSEQFVLEWRIFSSCPEVTELHFNESPTFLLRARLSRRPCRIIRSCVPVNLHLHLPQRAALINALTNAGRRPFAGHRLQRPQCLYSKHGYRSSYAQVTSTRYVIRCWACPRLSAW
jgi:hypothetical protein